MSGESPPGETENPRFAAEGVNETFQRIDSSHMAPRRKRTRDVVVSGSKGISNILRG
jgi:hypothetical protein